MNNFWQLGNVVQLKEPFESTYGTFTHGIIVEIYGHRTQGEVSHVSLFVYNPTSRTIYVAPGTHGVPVYVDYPVEDLLPYRDSKAAGYVLIERSIIP